MSNASKPRASANAAWRAIVALLAFGVMTDRDVNAADALHWATGAAFERTLAENVNIRWTNVPLRRAIRHLSEAKHAAILIDRRVDPDQKLNVTLENVPLGAAMQTIARDLGLGVARLGNVLYLGPASVAERLPGLAASLQREVRRLPAAAQRKYLSSKRLAWDDLAAPRDLLARLATESGVEITGIERFPHDLWAGADLPPLSLVDRLTLIAAQFDFTFALSQGVRRLDLTPLADD